MMSNYIFKGKSNEDLERLRFAIIEIIKEETISFEPLKPTKEQLEEQEKRNKIIKRINKSFNINCRYCECGGEIRATKEFFGDEKERNETRESFKKKFGGELSEPDGYNCINCGQVFDENFKKSDYKMGWL